MKNNLKKKTYLMPLFDTYLDNVPRYVAMICDGDIKVSKQNDNVKNNIFEYLEDYNLLICTVYKEEDCLNLIGNVKITDYENLYYHKEVDGYSFARIIPSSVKEDELKIIPRKGINKKTNSKIRNRK